MNAPVLLPAQIVWCDALRRTVAHAGGSQVFLRKTETPERLPNRFGSLPRQTVVIIRFPAIVGMSFDHDDEVRIIVQDVLESRSDLRQLAPFARPEVMRVGIEVQIRSRVRHPFPNPTRRRLKPAWLRGNRAGAP